MTSDSVPIFISEKVKAKLLQVHTVTPEEVEQCFCNREGRFLFDLRPEHVSDPPTQWFVAETNKRRKLKVCFVARKVLDDSGATTTRVDIRTAYEPNHIELDIYARHGT
jgi:hypothetical protein